MKLLLLTSCLRQSVLFGGFGDFGVFVEHEGGDGLAAVAHQHRHGLEEHAHHVVVGQLRQIAGLAFLVLGAGPGGYSAAFRAADLGLKVVLVERYSTLGGVCLNVGCIPSKALLHNAAVIDEVKHLAANGIKFAEPEIDIDMLRGYKEKVIGKLTGGLAGMAKARKVQVVRGVGQFLDPHHLQVETTDGQGQDKTGAKQVVKFKNAIIAAGSRVVNLPFIPQDPRIVDSTGALELKSVPKKMLIIGGGKIGRAHV